MIYQNRSYGHGTTTKGLIAQEIVDGKRSAELSSLLPDIQIVTHAMPIAKRLPTCRSIFLAIEIFGLLEQEKRIAMRRASWRRSRCNVVGDKGLAGSQNVAGTCFQAWLDPVQDGTENVK